MAEHPTSRPQKRFPVFLSAAALFLMLILYAKPLYRHIVTALYPIQYTEDIRHWAAEYELDPLLLCAFIRTESGFHPEAESSAGAIGLTQITEETFLWIKSKIAATEDICFADLHHPAISIRFGAYYIAQCIQRYNGDIATAAAAYHSGWGTVDRLLTAPAYSADGKTLDLFPYTQMRNYVFKIAKCYQKYQQFYSSIS